MPRLTKKPGHVAGLARTRRNAHAPSAVCDRWRGGGIDRREPALLGTVAHEEPRRDAECGRERRRARRTPRATTPRVTIHASGAPAITAPRLPANIVTPFSVAKRFGGNQTALILSSAMNATETPTPTSVRPAAAISHVGASANASEPSPATSDPTARMRRGPMRVGQHADRNLQQRVDVEVRRRERPQHGAVDRERARQLAGDRGGRGAMEERQDVAREDDAEDDAARRGRSGARRRGARHARIVPDAGATHVWYHAVTRPCVCTVALP